MEFGKEQSRGATLLAAHLERRLDGGEIRLVEKEAARATVNPILGTLEVLALCVEGRLLKKPSFGENHGHTLEDTSPRVPFRKVERLQLAIRKHTVSHANPLL